MDLLGTACLPSPCPFAGNDPLSYVALHHLSFTPRDHSIVYPSAAVASSSAGPAAVGNSAAETQNREESTDMGGDFNSPLSGEMQDPSIINR